MLPRSCGRIGPVRSILHIDMDAFFASVEQHDRPELRGKPLLVGHDGPRGVVTTASYEARPFGCRSAMPMVTAKRLCPRAIIVPVRMARYQGISEQVFQIMAEFSPLVEGLSIDEAFLDLTGAEHLFGGAEAAAGKLAADVVNHSDRGLMLELADLFQDYTPPNAADYRPDALVSPKLWPGVTLGWAIAYNTQLVKNAPKTWMDLTKPEYKDKQIGQVVGPSGGTTWTRLTSPTSSDNVTALEAWTKYRAILGSNAGEVYETWDGGATWESKTYTGQLTTDTVRFIMFVNDLVGFMAVNTNAPLGSVHRSKDGGATWEKLTTPTNAGLNSIEAIDENTAYVAGAASGGTGVILKVSG